MTKLVVVGGGRMGNALLGGLLRSGWAQPGDLAVVEKRADAHPALSERYPGVQVSGSLVPGEAAVLAVKPSDAETACQSMASMGYRRVLSIVAGVPLRDLEGQLGDNTAVVRAMSNTPAVLGLGAAAIAGGKTASDDDLAWAEAVLSSIGIVARVSENQLDAVTGLSGSGPAYVFLIAEALIDAGVLEGLDQDVSRALVVQTLLGSARLLVETGESPAALRQGVVSPGGTTAAALRVLESGGLRGVLIDAVVAATDRSRELGEGR